MDFTEFTTYLKSRVINPGFHFMENEALTALKMSIYNHEHQVPVGTSK